VLGVEEIKVLINSCSLILFKIGYLSPYFRACKREREREQEREEDGGRAREGESEKERERERGRKRENQFC